MKNEGGEMQNASISKVADTGNKVKLTFYTGIAAEEEHFSATGMCLQSALFSPLTSR